MPRGHHAGHPWAWVARCSLAPPTCAASAPPTGCLSAEHPWARLSCCWSHPWARVTCRWPTNLPCS
eukprot:9480556-Alexandrium_andersonii.AAC.1